MAQYAAIGIHAFKPFIDNSDVIWEKGKEKIQKYRRRSLRVFDDEQDSRPRAGQYAVAGADYHNRARSAGDYTTDYDSDEDYNFRRRGSRGRAYRHRSDDRYYDSAYESESSMPPRNRRAQSAKSIESAPSGTRGGGDDWSDDDSSSIMDSEEDEREEKKKRRGELLTGGIAAVATLHAAANVYGSMKAREVREKQLADGTISKEQAKTQRFKHHMQDAAAIGLAALSIKGAYGKWKGTHAKHKEFKNHRKERRERHQRRMEKGISRVNRDESDPTYGRGLPAPASYDEPNGYGARAVVTRPTYNRTYSRSLNDVGHNNTYQQGRRAARKAHRAHDDYDSYDDGDGYDVGNA